MSSRSVSTCLATLKFSTSLRRVCPIHQAGVGIGLSLDADAESNMLVLVCSGRVELYITANGLSDRFSGTLYT